MIREQYHHQMVENKPFLFERDRTAAAYWNGYVRGLCLVHLGKELKSVEEHQHRKWMELINDVDNVKRIMGKGYREGVKGR
jgi:hypothetical protein